MKGNAVTLEGSEDAGVGDATREASTKRQPDAWLDHRGRSRSQCGQM